MEDRRQDEERGEDARTPMGCLVAGPGRAGSSLPPGSMATSAATCAAVASTKASSAVTGIVGTGPPVGRVSRSPTRRITAYPATMTPAATNRTSKPRLDSPAPTDGPTIQPTLAAIPSRP